MNDLLTLIPSTFMMAAPLIIGACAGLYSERSGVVNICIDGGMIIGAFVSALVLYLFEIAGNYSSYCVWIACLAAMLATMLYISLLGFAAMHMRADQTIAGTALNVLAGGLTIYLCYIINGTKSTTPYSYSMAFSRISIPILKDIPYIGKYLFSNNYPTTYLAFIICLVSWFILYKTPFGLRLRSCGEFPQASASMGINVIKMRWTGVLISGALAGLAGATQLLTTQNYFFGNSINGLGFIAVATLIFGRWHPIGALFAGLFFGFAQSLSLNAQSIPMFYSWPSEIFKALPYFFTIGVLFFTSWFKGGAPKADGEIYYPGKR